MSLVSKKHCDVFISSYMQGYRFIDSQNTLPRAQDYCPGFDVFYSLAEKGQVITQKAKLKYVHGSWRIYQFGTMMQAVREFFRGPAIAGCLVRAVGGDIRTKIQGGSGGGRFHAECFPTNVSGELFAKDSTEMSETPHAEWKRVIYLHNEAQKLMSLFNTSGGGGISWPHSRSVFSQVSSRGGG